MKIHRIFFPGSLNKRNFNSNGFINLKSNLNSLPVVAKEGKVPSSLLESIVFNNLGAQNKNVLIGPLVGVDGAVIKTNGKLVVASDPITGSQNDSGRLVVICNANDVAVMGGKPEFLVLTVLLPPSEEATKHLERIMKQVDETCKELDIAVIGGHTEITSTVKQPVLCGTMLGHVIRSITAAGAKPGDRIILTKTAGIEGTMILLSEHKNEIVTSNLYSLEEVEKTYKNLSTQLSVVKEAMIGIKYEGVSAMHDPTEGGIKNALHELVDASKVGFKVKEQNIPFSDETLKLCQHFDINKLSLISSGALLLTCHPKEVNQVLDQYKNVGILAKEIGEIVSDYKIREFL